MWREAYGHIRRTFPEANRRVWRYQALRRVIDLMVTDFIAATEDRLRAEGIAALVDVRAFGRRLAGFSPQVDQQRLELKSFLMENLYRHYRVMRMAVKAKKIMTELFNAYVSEPSQLPPHILERRIQGESLTRVIADYVAGMTDRFALEEYGKLFDPFEKV